MIDKVTNYNIYFDVCAVLFDLVYMYVLQIFGVLRHLSFKRKVFISIPEMALMIFLLVPQLRRLIFYYDEAGIYQRGPVNKWFYYWVILVYTIAGICALMKYRNRISKQDFMAISYFVIAMILSIFAEGFFPGMHLRITIFLQSLCFFGAYICLENDEEAIDNETLVSKGVEFLQGYYYSKPLPEREFIDFIRRYN